MITISKMKNEDGFTLIELLIVIVVLGILAGIVLFAVGSTRGDATKSACQSDVKLVQTALEAYKAKTGNYPTGTSAAIYTTLISGNYIKAPAPSDVTVGDGTGATTPANSSLC